MQVFEQIMSYEADADGWDEQLSPQKYCFVEKYSDAE